ncbi:MAG: hypothetical protein RLZZ591_2010 [Pseudomonadota bacterium]
MPSLHPAHLVILAGVTAAMHVGKVPPAIPVLREALGMQLVEAGWLLSMSQMAGMLVAVFIGLFADAWGLRRSLLTGLVLMALASAAGAFARTVPTLLVLRALEGVAFLLVVVPAPALIRRLVVPGQLPLLMGWWSTFMPVGTATALLLGPLVMAQLHWSGWWASLSAVSLLMAAALWRGVRPPGAPEPAQTHAITQAQASGPSWHARLWATWRNPGTWWVALAFGAYSSQWMMVIGFMPTLLQAAGVSPFGAGVATAVTSLLNVVGNVMAGRLLHRGVPPRRVLSAAFGVMALGAWVTFGLADVVPVSGRLLAVGLFSAVGGLIPGSLFMLAVRVAPNEHTVSTSLGWTTQMSMMGQFLVPPLAAALAQSTGDWHLTWLINVLACALGVLLVWRLSLVTTERLPPKTSPGARPATRQHPT